MYAATRIPSYVSLCSPTTCPPAPPLAPCRNVTSPQFITLNGCASAFDTILRVLRYDGAARTLSPWIEDDDGCGGLQSRLCALFMPGVYAIIIEGHGVHEGAYTVSIDCSDTCDEPTAPPTARPSPTPTSSAPSGRPTTSAPVTGSPTTSVPTGVCVPGTSSCHRYGNNPRGQQRLPLILDRFHHPLPVQRSFPS